MPRFVARSLCIVLCLHFIPIAMAAETNRVGLDVSAHDPKVSLAIDAPLLWSTFLGGANRDYGTSIAVGDDGSVYVTGSSEATWGSPIRPYEGRFDAFVARFDPSGTLLWNTFLGADWYDYGGAIAVDGSGNVYVTGTSELGSWGHPLQQRASAKDYSFVARLDSSGSLLWSTFLGNVGLNDYHRIALDRNGNVYVVGSSSATWSSPWGSPGASYSGGYDAFVAKLHPSGFLLWNTFLGGAGDDSGRDVAVDESGNIYVTGYSTDTWGSPKATHGGGTDAFVAQLDPDGYLRWNTFFGSPGNEFVHGIAVDQSGNIFVTGSSTGGTWPSSQPVRQFGGGAFDQFVTRLDANGNVRWYTFLGGAGSDSGYGIAVDQYGNVYAAGNSDATWGSPARAYTAYRDVYAARLDGNGALLWNTFLGGAADDRLEGRSIAADWRGNVYVLGWSEYLTWGSPLRAFKAPGDAFIARFAAPAIEPSKRRSVRH